MSFFEELKRRRVIRVAVLYAAFAYAATEVTGVLQPALLLPEWTVRLVVLLLLMCSVSPEPLLLFGDSVGAARRALDMAWQRRYMWAGYVVGLDALRGYPDYAEARRRRGLPPS